MKTFLIETDCRLKLSGHNLKVKAFWAEFCRKMHKIRTEKLFFAVRQRKENSKRSHESIWKKNWINKFSVLLKKIGKAEWMFFSLGMHINLHLKSLYLVLLFTFFPYQRKLRCLQFYLCMLYVETFLCSCNGYV